jgi:uncharacterized membrane protein SirB2
MFGLLKLVHVSCAALSVSGFTLRGYWMLRDDPRLQTRWARVLPHGIDTLLLLSAIGMLLSWGVSPLTLPWLLAKITALLLYIGLGMVALRFGRSVAVRRRAYFLAIACYAYIICVAFSKNPLGPLALVG